MTEQEILSSREIHLLLKEQELTSEYRFNVIKLYNSNKDSVADEIEKVGKDEVIERLVSSECMILLEVKRLAELLDANQIKYKL